MACNNYTKKYVDIIICIGMAKNSLDCFYIMLKNEPLNILLYEPNFCVLVTRESGIEMFIFTFLWHLKKEKNTMWNMIILGLKLH